MTATNNIINCFLVGGKQQRSQKEDSKAFLSPEQNKIPRLIAQLNWGSYKSKKAQLFENKSKVKF